MSDKEAGQVLTSENSADFYANKLGLATETEPVQTEVVEVKSEPEAQDDAKPAEDPKPNRLEKRFTEITRQREMARQEAERERTSCLLYTSPSPRD